MGWSVVQFAITYTIVALRAKFREFVEFSHVSWLCEPSHAIDDSASAVTSAMLFPDPSQPPQNFKEYDPEWARAFYEGTVAVNCPHDIMLRQVKTPVLITHHQRHEDPKTGVLGPGALSDAQAMRAKELIESAGQRCDYQDHPTALHMMHQFDPELFTKVVVEWAATLH